jgi:DNA-binding transcriptional MerR regulator/methylmalonyl-CoA mutase cobalamin-binding subunit
MPSRARYKMGTVARLTGLSAGLLRMWERRHDLVRPHRTEGGHRMYSQQDLRLLLYIKARIDEGASIGELAQQGREALLEASRPEADDDAPAPESLPVPREVKSAIERWREALVQAAETLDLNALERTLDEAFATLNADVVVYQIIHQASHEIGRRWEGRELCVASEHLASGVFARRLLHLLAGARGIRPESPKALVACFPDELHSIGALVQAWELSRSGYDVTWLGAALPVDALAMSVRTTRPRAVFLSVSMRETYERWREALAAFIAEEEEGICWAVGGHGVPAGDPLLEDLSVGLFPELSEGDNPGREAAKRINSRPGRG